MDDQIEEALDRLLPPTDKAGGMALAEPWILYKHERSSLESNNGHVPCMSGAQ